MKRVFHFFCHPGEGGGRDNSKGFSLVEISIVLAIVGIVLVSSATILKPLTYNSQIDATEETMHLVFRRLSEFAQRNNRLPCPGDPADTATFGSERNTGSDAPGVGRCTGNTGGGLTEAEGIVPFAALGLPEEAVRDAWGNFITYRVAQPWTINFNDRDFGTAPNPNIGNTNDLNIAGAACLNANWVRNNENLNPGKALFCCTPPLSSGDAAGNVNAYDAAVAGIQVLDKNNASLFDPDGADGPIPAVRTAGVTGSIVTGSTAVVASGIRYNPNIAISVVLVSHGPNEHGAFIKGPDGGGGIRRVDRPDSASAFEQENADGDVMFYALPLNDKRGASYFDDIVMFRTTMQIYSENGVTSCAYPD